MENRNKFLLIALIIIIALFIIFRKPATAPTDVEQVGQNQTGPMTESVAPTAFAWRYEAAPTNNPDGIPQTKVFVDVMYPVTATAAATTESKLVDTTDGSCFDHNPSNAGTAQDDTKDKVAGTKVIQCYAAGFGYYFKIVRNGTSYEIMRKEFAEASPDFNPPEQPFVKIAEIPFK
ncbi:MAG: hypothetical protein KA028_01690 [Candidatus Pacebacteria bacterium]|nr:hypothetical protein [Candidatus Paceibacterota bacterium]MBP9852178.1 hypothetical protein [Candidatus Paceibacterota bacterium]